METAVKTIAAHKGLDVVVLEVKEHCSFADYFIIASGTSRRHVLALAEHVEEAMGKAGQKPMGVEGVQEGLWVLLDYNAVVVHLFFQPLRELYDLEGLWGDAPQVPLEEEIPASPPPSLS